MPEKKTAVILMARPGGGKTTVMEGVKAADIKAAELPFRAKMDREVSEGTELGATIDYHRKAGLLVPNETLLPLVDEAFADVADAPFLFLDGLPRNLAQLQFALERTRHFGFRHIVALHINTPVDIALSRLLERKRDAADIELPTLIKRSQVFEEETGPMITRVSRDAGTLGIEYHMICGINLKRNIHKYVPLMLP